MHKIVIVLLCTFLGCFHSSTAQEKGSLQTRLQSAKELYLQKQYAQAAAEYKSLVASGVKNAAVYYNVGNCFYKIDSIAQAMLWYERALLLSPDDEDIKHNIALTKLRTTDKIEPLPKPFFKQWNETIYNAFSSGTWAIFLWVSVALVGGMLALAVVLKKQQLRIIVITVAIFFALPAIATFWFGSQRAAAEEHSGYGIVMAKNLYVKSEPRANSTDLFIVHEGLKVEILDSSLEFSKIRLADGNQGWVLTSAIEEI